MEYRGNQCPARGPGLSHTQNGPPGTPCAECGTRVTPFPPPGVPPTATQAGRTPEVTIDVVERMRRLGFGGAYRDITGAKRMYKDEPTPRDDVLVEPRMITGEGPQGKPDGRGRGDLTPSMKARLLKVAAQQDWLDANKPIERKGDE